MFLSVLRTCSIRSVRRLGHPLSKLLLPRELFGQSRLGRVVPPGAAGNYWNCTHDSSVESRLCVYDVMDTSNQFEVLSHGVCVPSAGCSGASGPWGSPMDRLVRLGAQPGCRQVCDPMRSTCLSSGMPSFGAAWTGGASALQISACSDTLTSWCVRGKFGGAAFVGRLLGKDVAEPEHARGGRCSVRYLRLALL